MARKRATAKAVKPLAKAKDGDKVFRLKITLDRFRPAIWRRVETPDCTLEDLHDLIQACMPWYRCHLWEFRVGQQHFGPEMENDGFGVGFDDDTEPADEVRLSSLAAAGVKKFRYTYDFGDSWEHTIALEKPVARDPKQKYPRCIAGEMASPPEDCGGVWGYEDLLEILDDRMHPDHEEWLGWVGGPIDPKAFNRDAINKNLQRLKLK